MLLLPGAGFADDAECLAWLQMKRHVAHGGVPRRRIADSQVADLEQRRFMR